MNRLEEILTESIAYSDSKGDQKDFQALLEYAVRTPSVKEQPPFLEIGTRGGGSALAILRIIEEFFHSSTTLVTVDPYGDKPYDGKPWKYGDKFYVQMKKTLSSYGNHIHYQMVSVEFINIMDTVHYWFRGKERNFTELSFVLLDGSHLPETVMFEYNHLFPRLIKGGYMIIDNTNFYNKQVQKHFRYINNKSREVINTKDQTIIKRLR